MPGSTNTGESRPPTGANRPPAGPEFRSMLTRERRCAPALLVVAACAAIAASGAGLPAWIWLAVFAVNVGVRAWLAHKLESADPIPALSSPPPIVYFASHGIDIVLWAVLFAAIGNAGQAFSSGAGFAAGGAVLLATLTTGGWKPAWQPIL